MKTLLLTAIALLVAESSLPAAEKPRASVKVSLFTFQYAEGYRKIFLPTDKGTHDEISLSTANIIGPFKTPLNDKGLVTLCEHAASEDGADIYPVIAGVKIPSSVKEPIIILFPSRGKAPYSGLVIDRSVTDFPEGSYKLINFSKSKIRALIGKTQVMAAPQQITRFDPSSNPAELLDVHFQYNHTNNWRTFGRTRWVNDKKGRTLLCAFIDQRTQRMRIRGIPLR